MAKLRFSMETWKVDWSRIIESDDGHLDVTVCGTTISKEDIIEWIPFMSYRTIEKNMEKLLNDAADRADFKVIAKDYTIVVDVDDQAMLLLTDDYAYFMRIRNARAKY